MKLVKKGLKLLNGKKTFIGLAIFFVLHGLQGIGQIDEETFNQLVVVADLIIGAGLAHKIKKAVVK